MALSHEIISQFAKIVKADKKKSSESTLYGTVVTDGNGSKYVKLDGSDQLTPLTDNERPSADITIASANNGERVSVLIKDHTATVTGNISSPSVRTGDFSDLSDQVTDIKEFDIVIADRVQANEGYIKKLQADKANIGDLTAATAKITELEAKKADIDDLTAATAEITDLKTTKLDADVADITYATIESLEATDAKFDSLDTKFASIEKLDAQEARIDTLETTKLSTEQADLKYANIDFTNIGKAAIENFYATSGIIKDLVIGDTSVTGMLVGVTIVGDLIEGGTVKADKLVILGDDGLYYKLNTNGVSTTAEQTEYNSLNGSVITAHTITAEKVNVDDLVAFDATIGGFNISESAIYSGAKASVDNTTTGIYLDKEGQVAFGDTTNFVKYYKDSAGEYVLEISADRVLIQNGEERTTVNQLVDDAASDLQTAISDANKETLDSCAESINKALDNYVRDGDYTEYKQFVKTQLDILASQIEMNFTTTIEEITSVDGEIQSKFNELSKYIRFSVDGIELGATDNPLKLSIDNDIIRFEKNGETIGWWDGVDFHTGNIVVDVQERAQFGNFAFIPRSDGSLMFLKVSS